jgi:hypothetical protein
MDTKKRALALNALSPIELRLDINGNWFVRWVGVEIKKGPCLGGAGERGATPDEAIDRTWASVEDMSKDRSRYLVVGAYTDQRKAVRWNGFMWEIIIEEKAA